LLKISSDKSPLSKVVDGIIVMFESSNTKT
jgi:hypothetical protein